MNLMFRFLTLGSVKRGDRAKQTRSHQLCIIIIRDDIGTRLKKRSFVAADLLTFQFRESGNKEEKIEATNFDIQETVFRCHSGG